MSAYVQTVVGSDSPPVGAVMDFAGNVEPSGWLFCFGQSLPRTGIYAQLFQVIGTLYGSVDGSSFSLPDFRGRVGAGKDNMGGTAANRLQTAWGVDGVTLGANGGSQSHQLTSAQLASHTHLYSLGTFVAGAYGAFGTSWAPSTTPTASGYNTGDQAHPNVQPTFIVNKIIKYTVSGTVLPIVPGEGDVVGPDGGVADGDLAVFNGTSGKIIRRGSLLPRNYLSGLLIFNSTDAANDIDISVGECRDDTNAVDIRLLTSMTKQLDAVWAAGTNQGARVDAALADGTWHVFLIMKADLTVDLIMSSLLSSPTLPSGYVYKRRIASITRTGGILAFRQLGDYINLVTPVDTHVGASILQNGSFLLQLTGACPTGLKIYADVAVQMGCTGANAYSWIGDPDNATTGRPSIFTGTVNVLNAVRFCCWTNTAGQVRVTSSTVTGTYSYTGAVYGYWDTRGKDR